MSLNLALLAILFWMVLLGDGLTRICLFLLAAAYLACRKKWGLIALLAICSISAIRPEQIPVTGNYLITEVKANYAIAKKGNTRILVYAKEAGLHDRMEITSLEPVYSQDNLKLFSFSRYLKGEGITHTGTGTIVEKGHSLQAKIYNRLKNNTVMLRLYYGISDGNSWLDRCGLPILCLLSLLEKWKCPKGAVLVLAILYGWLFRFPLSLFRYILFRLVRGFQLSRLSSWALSVILLLAAVPNGALHFSFVLPAVLQLLSILDFDNKAFTRMVSLFLQGAWFGEIGLFNLFFFKWMRTGLGLVFLTAPFMDNLPVLDWLDRFSIPVHIALPAWILLYVLARKADRKKKILIPAALLAAVCLSGPHLDPFFHVYMFDMGQGDATLIVEPFLKSAVMIDCGENWKDTNTETLYLPFLKAAGIHRLDALILSHGDHDHDGGQEALLEGMQVETVITDGNQPVPVEYPFLHLLPDRVGGDENEQSLISLFSYDGYRYLWTGDAGLESESRLMETWRTLDVDILKAGHHGSATASGYPFLEWIAPRVCLISVGKDNMYGHPAPSVLDSLAALNIPAIRTDVDGMVHLFSWGPFHFLETASGKITLL